MPETLILSYGLPMTLICLAVGAVASVAFGLARADRAAWCAAHVMAFVGSGVGLLFALVTLGAGATLSIRISLVLGTGPEMLTFLVDPLAALFVAVICTVALAASLFGIGSYDTFAAKYRLGHFGVFYTLFIGSMLLVVTAGNALLFLLAWEIMAVTSYFLVVFERHESQNVKAGMLYLLISQLGAAFLFAAFLLLYRFTGSWDFEVIRATAGTMPFLFQNVVLGLALVGLAAKAGVIPLHIWLPEAHPAAPSHVSALMSGVMIKTAIFTLIRFFVDFFPTVHVSWGILILLLGAVSSLLGVLYALAEHDIKRLLAFHSVENIGIILLGLGGAITFFSYDLPIMGTVALVAALYHTVNHAIFKALLFLSAGSVVHATGTRNMEEYGGLIKVMPLSAALFLVGAVAISGLPPFNGFVSEWLTFQSLFAGVAILPLFAKGAFFVGAASLAFTGGLAAACFVKAFGTIFLARARSEAALHAHEARTNMLVGMTFLAALTLLFGIAARTITPWIAAIGESVRTAGTEPPTLLASTLVPPMAGIAIAIAGTILLVYLLTQMYGRRAITVGRTWDCGVPLTPRMEITATGFSRSIVTVFRGLLRPTTQTQVEYQDASLRYFTSAQTVHASLPDLYYAYLYRPAIRVIERGARGAKRIQTGNLHAYLLYVSLTLMILLAIALR